MGWEVALGAALGSVGSKKPKVSTTDPTKQIEPEPQYEENMRLGLTDQANRLLSSGINLQTMANGMTSRIPGLATQTINWQQGLMNGQLPAAFQTNFENSIRSGVQNTVGTIANDLARRGVGLNGTSFTNQLNSVNQAVADAAAKNFSSNVGLLSGMAGDALNTAVGVPTSLSQLGMQQLQVPYNLYGTWRNSRYGNQGQTVVDPGSSPPLAGVGSLLVGKSLGLFK